ncbi:uncharacterized protein LOC126981285 [Eriocheir sinensis]|uniref:uncharacterized protein LOC126981285 n=1 Tax=Eriocheir sinensis TaxID=95602 RepID=UPI0021C9C6C3|nr:uncharacterized protein LOC126981285 [Eriocheir sinensis]
MREFTEDELERFTCKCLEFLFYVVYFIAVLAAFLLGSEILGFVMVLVMPVLYMGISALYKRVNRVEGNHGSNRMNQPYQMPINSVSSSIPQAPPLTGQPPPFNFVSNVDAEAARRHAANLQPPLYLEEVRDSIGLSLPLYTTPATDEASAKVFGPSSDGLPSYEAAMSTWQPPVDEELPSSRDDGQRTND